MKKTFLTAILSILIIQSHAIAGVPVGEWEDHLPYNQAKFIVETPDRIYCATYPGSIFYFQTSDNSIQKLSKVNGLNDIGIAAINYSPIHDALFIAYENSNIDIVIANTTYNFPDIKNKTIVGDKSIKSICFHNNDAYLSCGFGIIKFNMQQREFSDQYYIGDNGVSVVVNDVAIKNDTIIAATTQGLKWALLSTNLSDFNNWKPITDIPFNNDMFLKITLFQDNIFALYKNKFNNETAIFYGNIEKGWTELKQDGVSIKKCNSIKTNYNKLVITSETEAVAYSTISSQAVKISDVTISDAIIDVNGIMWLGERWGGLTKTNNTSAQEYYIPKGPFSSYVLDIDSRGDVVSVAGGSLNLYSGEGAYIFEDQSWKSTISNVGTPLNLWATAIDPSDTKRIFCTSSGKGLVEFRDGVTYKIYDPITTNGMVENAYLLDPAFTRLYGLSFDKENSLWFTSSGALHPIYKMSKTGTIQKIETKHKFGRPESSESITILDNGWKWVEIDMNTDKIYMIDDNNTVDIKEDNKEAFLYLRNQENESFNDINCVVKDLEGNIWIGTEKGPIVYYNPDQLMPSDALESTFAQEIYTQGTQIKIPRNDGTNNADFLLGTETINTIAIDGANRKWFGTKTSGVYLSSEDGTKELHHFTADNSPLPSDNIISIAIKEKTGEVFIGTDKGIVVYRGDATLANEDFKDVYVFPNPVREDYYGNIAITGLVKDCDVKITDISGNIVYQTKSLGGEATWNGENFNGQRVATGVYLIFLTDQEGSKTHITKVLFIN